ncbi:Rec8 like protein-domain-containing protein [Kockovaella imperatae]|uniref:Rec8 like protein-domain-containing protein n=1 Tax=Kockovaella imperatae TaxID=4999 RepID=A0A1Y1UA38_9TREE|nr:Rec8 like protein-domain-containing protein [Kockovaella imperatae]ORX34377.1 Rec8 like protein-domain-containing protein [Kockovaella imperatae]
MLLTELILSKRGPLAKVWLSAHQERKLSKQQALGVDVEESCDAILEQDEGPTTLRLSGQLMLGVTRIYSRKVQYLLDDCKETREKISIAFRPGIVDLPEDQIRANKNAITFSDLPTDFNVMDWNWTAPNVDLPAPPLPNLRPTTREFGAYNFGRPRAPSIYGGSQSSRHASHDGETSSHIDSGDFSGVDLGLQLDDMDVSMEQGRHVSVEPSQRAFSKEPSMRGSRLGSVGLQGMDDSFGPVDLDLNFGDDSLELPRLEERSRRESSALSTPPPASPSQAQLDVTPRTAARVQKDAAPKPKRARFLTADQELELPEDAFALPGEDSDILTTERFIASDLDSIRYAEMISRPDDYFLPKILVDNVPMIYAGPPGLAPDLASLFTFPANILRRNREEETTDPSANKRPRLEQDVEAARRDSLRLSEQAFDVGPSGFEDHTMDIGGGEMDLGAFDQVEVRTPPRGQSLAPSRAESLAREIQFGDSGDYPLAMFASSSRTESQSIPDTPTKSVVGAPRDDGNRGVSRNTGMAMGLLRRELEAIEAEDEEPKVVNFKEIAQGANRRAASAFFFELLVLGTKDMIQLKQPKPFGDINVKAKEGLWEGSGSAGIVA